MACIWSVRNTHATFVLLTLGVHIINFTTSPLFLLSGLLPSCLLTLAFPALGQTPVYCASAAAADDTSHTQRGYPDVHSLRGRGRYFPGLPVEAGIHSKETAPSEECFPHSLIQTAVTKFSYSFISCNWVSAFSFGNLRCGLVAHFGPSCLFYLPTKFLI